MLRFKRDTLVKLNYWFVGLLALTALLIVISATNPEKMIVGEWKEVGWYFEKPDASIDRGSFDMVLHNQVRKEIMDKLDVLHVDIWRFSENGTVELEPEPNESNLEWSVKGSGHVLELRKDGDQLESFQIQKLNQDELELHLILDLQLKGVVKIVLKRTDQENLHAKKVQ